MLQIPHVFPSLTQIYPDSPQLVPHEFLTCQPLALTPTRVTPWLSLVEQLLKVPDLYDDQLEASTATETGHLVRALAKSLQLVISVYPDTLNVPSGILHFP